MKLKPGATVGEFRIERLLSNQGATAQVYLASRDTQQVALKIARTGSKKYVFQDHLRQEVAILQKLTHAGVVRLYPVLDDSIYIARADSLPSQPWYFAMEYINGQSLTDYLPYITDEFPLAWRFDLFRLIVGTVVYLHAQGYAHCDLKPDNIFLGSSSVLQPILIDFGSACSISAPPPLISITVPYAAPELLQTISSPTKASLLRPELLDTWALGAIFYELVVGERLISGNNRRAIIKNTLSGQFDFTKIPPMLRSILAKMLQLRSNERASVQEIQAEFPTVR